VEPYLSSASAFIAYTRVNITLHLPFYSPPTPMLYIPLLRVCLSVVTRRRCVIESETLYWPAEVFNRKACVFMTSRQVVLPCLISVVSQRARECACVCLRARVRGIRTLKDWCPLLVLGLPFSMPTRVL
jgi:hypothetical protein